MMPPLLSTSVAHFRQDRILDAALAVFARRGFHAASMRDVAAEAGVAPGSIYNHFENKAALLVGILERMSTRAAEAPPPPPPGAGLHDLLAATIDRPLAAVTGETAELFRVILAEALVDRALATAFRERVLAPMLSACDQALGPHLPAADRATWLRLVPAIVLGLLMQRLVDPGATPPPSEAIAGALLAGLRDAAP